MVGCFQRKSTGWLQVADASDKQGRTGFFQRKSTGRYVLMWRGEEIATYNSVDEFVREHMEGLRTLEAKQNALLESQYKSTP